MTDLNEYECQMLDTVLDSFGVPDTLTREQLLQLFDNDETTAYAMVQALAREDLVVEAGKPGHYELPEKLILKPKGEKFLKEGGFTKRYHYHQQQIGGTHAKLQQQNLRLQNEKLALETELARLQRSNRNQKIWLYLLMIFVFAAFLIGKWLARPQ